MSYTEQDVADWKKKHGKIYTFSDRNTDYVFRELTFVESDEIVETERNVSSADAEDLTVQMGLLYPYDMDLDNIPAGVVSVLAEEILEVSSFGSVPYARSVLDKHREVANTVRTTMKAFVLATMPAYKSKELDELTFDGLAELVALAEQIIKVNQSAFGVEGDVRLHLVDPAEEAEKERLAAEKHAAQKKPGQAGYNDPIAEKLAQALG